MDWLRTSLAVKGDIHKIDADDVIGILIDAAKRFQRGGLVGAMRDARCAVVGGPAIFGQEHGMPLKQMVCRYDLVCRLLRHNLLQSTFGSRPWPDCCTCRSLLKTIADPVD
jgi:hypothetical protein